MPTIPLAQHMASQLVEEALGEECASCGMVVGPAGGWNDGERRVIGLGSEVPRTLVHDERGAPLDPTDPGLLVSLTDEADLALCAWARPLSTSRIAGIGIDLASISDFAGERGATYNRLLFSPAELDIVHATYPHSSETGFAYAFSAKEAAFKSLSAPLRTWYAHHDDRLEFELREFELADATHERGTLRHAQAQAAMTAMGIRSIRLFHRELGDAVLTLAVARHAKLHEDEQ